MNNSICKMNKSIIKRTYVGKLLGKTVDKFGFKACKKSGVSLLLDTSGSMK